MIAVGRRPRRRDRRRWRRRTCASARRDAAGSAASRTWTWTAPGWTRRWRRSGRCWPRPRLSRRLPSSTVAVYARILRTPGVAPVVFATLIGRLPIGISGLAILLYVREVTGSYAAAGAAAGALALGGGVGAPLQGRLVDRRGLACCCRSRLLHAAGLIGGLGRGGGRCGHRAARARVVRRRRRDPTRHVGAALALAVPARRPARADPERLRPRLGARRGRVRLRTAADHGPGGHRGAGVRADRIRRVRPVRHGAAPEDAPHPARPGARRPRQLGARPRGARRPGSACARVRQRAGGLHARVDRGGAPRVQRGGGVQGAGGRAPRDLVAGERRRRAWRGARAERISRCCDRTCGSQCCSRSPSRRSRSPPRPR